MDQFTEPSNDLPSTAAHDKADGFVRKARQGVWRGGWALADHVLFAGTNFLVQLGLARQWLNEHDFGVFAGAYVSFLILGVFQTALLTEPVAVFGAKRYRENLPVYLSKVVGMHLMLSVIGGLMLGLVGALVFVYGEPTLGIALCALAVAQVFQLLTWTLRVSCYIESNPMHAGVSGLLYLVIVLVLLFEFDAMGWMSIPMAVAAMAIASMVVCIYLMYWLGISARHVFERSGYAQVMRHHWRYGKWAMPTGFMLWVPDHLPVLAVPVVLGWAAGSDPDFESGGALKAMLHLSVPFILFIRAVATLLVPMLVRRIGTPAFATLSWRIVGFTATISLVAWPVLGYQHERIIQLIYGGSFIEHASLLWLVGLIPVIIAVDSVLHAQLRALERSDRIFYVSAASSAAVVLIGLPMLLAWGLTGILYAILISYAVQIVVLWIIGGKIIRSACRPPISLASAPTQRTLTGTPTLTHQPQAAGDTQNPSIAEIVQHADINLSSGPGSIG